MTPLTPTRTRRTLAALFGATLLLLLVLLNYRWANIATAPPPLEPPPCQPIGVEILPPSQLPILNGVTMSYGGGTYLLMECDDGSRFHIRPPKESP